MLQAQKKVEWDEIEVGEVFATQGCWDIFCKMSNSRALFLASDEEWRNDDLGKQITKNCLCPDYFKLSKETQECWRN